MTGVLKKAEDNFSILVSSLCRNHVTFFYVVSVLSDVFKNTCRGVGTIFSYPDPLIVFSLYFIIFLKFRINKHYFMYF